VLLTARAAIGVALVVFAAATCRSGEKDACVGKACGDPCDYPAGADPGAGPGFCSAQGTCSPLVPHCGALEPCGPALECPAYLGGQVVCEDGSIVVATPRCFFGYCISDVPPCRCRPQLAIADGFCDINVIFELGYVWDGFECHALLGCTCLGPDCGDAFPDEESCLAFYEMCLEE